MAKNIHEIRDPIHDFIRIGTLERKHVLDSRPLQRLRHIHQTGLTYLVYPGATHKRFEHSLGVMELASRVFDVITAQDALTDEVRNALPAITFPDEADRLTWRRILRMAALCHDVGHLSFSHITESLLPEGWDHERLTVAIILSDELKSAWDELGITYPERIAKLAVGEKAKDFDPNLELNNLERILSEIIVGDVFGVDRMDYLWREAHHTGVVSGKFDHHRLIDTLRILPENRDKLALGIEEGGLRAAESLLFARYFMYSQVYLHPVIRIYNIHLKEFLEEWLELGKFATDVTEHLNMTDIQVSAGLFEATTKFHSLPNCKGKMYDAARRIVERDHFKVLYEPKPEEINRSLNSGLKIYEAVKQEFGEEMVRHDEYGQRGFSSFPRFPVLTRDGSCLSSTEITQIKSIPQAVTDYVFIHPEVRAEAERWLKENRSVLFS